eukprot:m.54752 g.54752  ORF g.54752 m.54752 type:complete len:109 (-) comp15523_c0_seq3:258-584(-)
MLLFVFCIVRPAANVQLSVKKINADGSFSVIAEGSTNSDGRCPGLVTQEIFAAGTYQIRFETAKYFEEQDVEYFYPFCEITFIVKDPSQHFHVPLLLNPFGFSTYRGS